METEPTAPDTGPETDTDAVPEEDGAVLEIPENTEPEEDDQP